MHIPTSEGDEPVGTGPKEGPGSEGKALEHFCEDDLRELGLFSQEKGKLWGSLGALFSA